MGVLNKAAESKHVRFPAPQHSQETLLGQHLCQDGPGHANNHPKKGVAPTELSMYFQETIFNACE